ncbi:MAG: ABC transporter ATP-binding protein [Limosilactobacillus sp.]|uniref:ABC transporter ATP-binding protein n=1 Tax=Limosilactobacillus sp. TaxID=2773925 RepID=UPI0027078C57|nr:ABC transporter ATP-binding protein [Limosilactobacillus sp.]
MSKIVQVSDITKTYGSKREKQYKVLKGISFDIESGEFVAVMGASGSGKSTLLNCLSTLDKPTSGTIKVADRDLTTLKNKKLTYFRGKEIGFIFQDFNLLGSLTNRENIALPLTLQGVKAKEIDGKIEAIAERLGIKEILDKYPTAVSGGQKQRVAAARALVHDPSIILADEPTGALDSNSSREMLKLMSDLNEQGVTILMVTHDLYSASYANRILFIKDGLISEEIKKADKSQQEFYHELIQRLETEA